MYLLTIVLLLVTKSVTLFPLLLEVPCRPYFPITVFKYLFLYALKSTLKFEYLQLEFFDISDSFYRKTVLSSSSFSFVGAGTENIVNLFNFTLIRNNRFLSSTASKFIIACLYFLLIINPIPKCYFHYQHTSI
jgi:hypothetical protein